MTYKPLPTNVAVAPSTIHGTGLVAMEEIEAGHEFGITHVKDERFENGYIRTPLGGFFNHSDDPNCETIIDGDLIRLRSIRQIKPGDEITAVYWLYDINSPAEANNNDE